MSELSVTPLADGKQWRINTALLYNSALVKPPIIVPKGFVTDFASIPVAMRLRLPVWEKYGSAAVLHDWLYWDQSTTRDKADQVLREAMSILAVPGIDALEIYEAVHLFGGGAWDRNTALKQSGYKRMALGSNPPYASMA